jgi:hypothetical protein
MIDEEAPATLRTFRGRHRRYPMQSNSTPIKLYHLSVQWLGRKPTLEPRTPRSRANGESDAPRVCVAPTIEGCWLSICSEDPYFPCGGVHVYEVVTDKSIPADKTVDDRKRTGERWILEPVELRHVCKIPPVKNYGRIEGWHGKAYRRRIVAESIRSEFAWEMDWRKSAKTPKQPDTSG